MLRIARPWRSSSRLCFSRGSSGLGFAWGFVRFRECGCVREREEISAFWFLGGSRFSLYLLYIFLLFIRQNSKYLSNGARRCHVSCRPHAACTCTHQSKWPEETFSTIKWPEFRIVYLQFCCRSESEFFSPECFFLYALQAQKRALYSLLVAKT